MVVLLYSELDQLYSYLECLLVYCRLVYKTKFCVMLLYVLFFLQCVFIFEDR